MNEQENKNEVVETNKSTALSKMEAYNQKFLPMIESNLSNFDLSISSYGKLCLGNAMASIIKLLSDNDLSFKSENLVTDNLGEIFQNVALLELNAAAKPNEIFFQIRNKNIGSKDHPKWVKTIEQGIEGDGHEVLVDKFGRNVDKVEHRIYVFKGDEFKPPRFEDGEWKSLEYTPKFESQRIEKVCYGILMTDGNIQWHVTTREQVVPNLKAHVRQNMMKLKDKSKKFAILKEIDDMGLDWLKTKNAEEWASAAWRDSDESMIQRKMRNNILRKIPKDFSSSLQAVAIDELDQDQRTFKANNNAIDVTAEDVTEPKTIAFNETQEEIPPHNPNTGEVIDVETDEVTEENSNGNKDLDFDGEDA